MKTWTNLLKIDKNIRRSCYLFKSFGAHCHSNVYTWVWGNVWLNFVIDTWGFCLQICADHVFTCLLFNFGQHCKWLIYIYRKLKKKLRNLIDTCFINIVQITTIINFANFPTVRFLYTGKTIHFVLIRIY